MQNRAIECKKAVGVAATKAVIGKFATELKKVQPHDYAECYKALTRRMQQHDLALDAEFSHVEAAFRTDKRVDAARDMLLVALTAHVAARLDVDSSRDLRALLAEFQQALADKEAAARGL